MNRVVEIYSVYIEHFQCGLCQRQQSWIGGLDKARCDDIGDLSGDVVISFRLRHEGFTFEDCLRRQSLERVYPETL